MPEMGIPKELTNRPNPFAPGSGVSMAKRNVVTDVTSEQKNEGSGNVGAALNEVAGSKMLSTGGTEYVDEKKHNVLGKNEFMKLLTHQMQNQDPMNPMDQSKLTADMAQFAQLEQLTNMNANLGKQSEDLGMKNKFYAASFLGKEITTSGSTLKMSEFGEVSNINFSLPVPAQKVAINVYDQRKQLVATKELEGVGMGGQLVPWDGIGLDSKHVGPGEFFIDVKAWDESLSPIDVKTQQQGIVTGVHFEGEDVVFTVDQSKKVFMRDVSSFRLPANAAKNTISSELTNAREAAKQYENMQQGSGI